MPSNIVGDTLTTFKHSKNLLALGEKFTKVDEKGRFSILNYYHEAIDCDRCPIILALLEEEGDQDRDLEVSSKEIDEDKNSVDFFIFGNNLHVPKPTEAKYLEIEVDSKIKKVKALCPDCTIFS